MTHHLVWALLIPLLTALATTVVGSNRVWARVMALVGSSAGLLYALWLLRTVWLDGPQMTVLGGWPLPYGITLTADMLSAVMVGLSALMGWTVLLYTFATLDPERERFFFYPLYHFLLMGVNGAFLAGDLFNLYVWFELMLIASFGLMTLGGERGQLEGGLKYVVINLLSSSIFLIGVGLLYSVTGTLNMAHLAEILSNVEPTPLLAAIGMLFLVTFGVKGAFFPLFFWLPASYHTPPVAVTALFGGLLTKVGVYALYRIYPILFTPQVPFANDLILILAALTMIVGVLGAIAQNNVRRILSFHIISQIGYMLMGLGLATVAGVAGGIFYIVHHIIVKTALLVVGGTLEHTHGSGELDQMGGQLRQRPILALLFLLAALSLAGIPPFSGFFSKLALLMAAAEQRQYVIAAVSLIVSLLTLFSMSKIWIQAFWKPALSTAGLQIGGTQWSLLVSAMLLVTFTVLMGLGAESVLSVVDLAAIQLLDPTAGVTLVP